MRLTDWSLRGIAPSLFISLFLGLISLVTLWQFFVLKSIPETPNQDLARHIASVINFRDAFLDGQFLPRMQLLPASYPDLPVFQFYGSMLGLLSLPFLSLNFEPILAVALAIFIVRWLGAIAIYASGRLLGANRLASLLASLSYLLTPYLISNVYGRVALPEATAHGLIAVLFYGVLRLAIRADFAAIAIVCSSIVGLSLAHPIFLIYGCIMGGLVIVTSCSARAIIINGLVFVGSFLIASFQWYPGFLIRYEFATEFINTSPTYANRFTSYSGLFGFPASLSDENILASGSTLFFTPGILTLPILIALISTIRLRFAFSLLCGLILFLLLSYTPFDLWRFVPQIFWSVQFPYRLLAFVSLFTAIGVCVALPRLSALQFLLIAALLTTQSFQLLFRNHFSGSVAVTKADVPSTFASVDYIIVPPAAVTSPDGWLRYYAIEIFDSLMDFVVDQDKYLLDDNKILLARYRVKESYLRISGAVDGTEPASLSLEVAGRFRQTPMDRSRSVGPGEFSEIFRIPSDLVVLKIVANASVAKPSGQAAPRARIKLHPIERLPGNEIRIDASQAGHDLRLAGHSVFPDAPVDLWFARPTVPDLAVSGKVSVGPGAFDAKLKLPAEPGSYMIVPSRVMIPSMHSTSADARKLSVNLSSYLFSAGDNAEQLVSAKAVRRTFSHGYRREFEVTNPAAAAPAKGSSYLVELPMSYNPLVQISQHGDPRTAVASDRGLALVRSSDLATPFVARFAMPWIVWPMMLAGIGIIFIGARMQSQKPRDAGETMT